MNQTKDASNHIRRQLRTEGTIHVAEQLLVFWLENKVAEGVFIEPAIARGQERITNFCNGLNSIRLWLEDMTPAVRISSVTGSSLTCETRAGLDGGREEPVTEDILTAGVISSSHRRILFKPLQKLVIISWPRAIAGSIRTPSATLFLSQNTRSCSAT